MTRRTLTLRGRSPDAQRELELAELSDLLSDDRFAKYLWRWFGKSGMYQSTYGGSADATFYWEGRRALGLDMLAECEEARPGALREIFTRGGEGIPGRSGQQERSAPEEPDERYASES